MVLNGRSRFKEYIHECIHTYIHTYMYMACKVLKSCKIKMSVICIDEIMKTVCPPCYQHVFFGLCVCVCVCVCVFVFVFVFVY